MTSWPRASSGRMRWDWHDLFACTRGFSSIAISFYVFEKKKRRDERTNDDFLLHLLGILLYLLATDCSCSRIQDKGYTRFPHFRFSIFDFYFLVLFTANVHEGYHFTFFLSLPLPPPFSRARFVGLLAGQVFSWLNIRSRHSFARSFVD